MRRRISDSYDYGCRRSEPRLFFGKTVRRKHSIPNRLRKLRNAEHVLKRVCGFCLSLSSEWQSTSVSYRDSGRQHGPKKSLWQALELVRDSGEAIAPASGEDLKHLAAQVELDFQSTGA
jgi:hypothetical protein